MNLLQKNIIGDVNPIQITIDISGSCNAKCPFCLRQLSKNVQNGFMRKEIFYNIIDQVKKIESIKVIALSAYGEPLLHPDFDEFVEYLSSLNYNILVITNMSLAHKHFDSLLKLTHIIYSIEGHDKQSYEKFRKNLEFDSVFKNIKEFDKLVNEKRKNRQLTPSRMINFVLTKKSKIIDFYNLWREYVDLLTFNMMVNPLIWNDKLKIFQNAVISEFENDIIQKPDNKWKNGCIQPFTTIVVRPDGKLALCCNDADSNIDFGDYRDIKGSFFENENFKSIRGELAKRRPVVCQNCKSCVPVSKKTLIEYFPEIIELHLQTV